MPQLLTYPPLLASIRIVGWSRAAFASSLVRLPETDSKLAVK